ncbi:hypothetical protein MtrunA17_Chr8g0378081 [Medicago truncatula]|uniref:Uncharacterized protein n=1 Tax=Medicago truncatula TaxID=3880 RepID=A0A396GN29_MEDTR|nr:hypothetical protein MtrunA17_Chr8g0378081 [Medicago truncatula]
MKCRDLLIKMFRQNVNLLLILSRFPLIPQLKLSNDLVGEGAGHHKTRVSSSTTQVHQTTLGQDNDAGVGLGENPPVGLRLDGDALHTRVVLKSRHINFIVKVTNVANNGIVFHFPHVINHDDVLVTGGGNKDVSIRDNIIKIIDINSREQKSSTSLHLIKPLNTSSSLFRNTNKSILHLTIPLRISLQPISNDSKHKLKLSVISRTWIRNLTSFLIKLFSLNTFMDQQSSITTIINNQIRTTTWTPVKSTFSTPPVLLKSLTLPGENGGAVTSDGGGGVVLS